VVSGLQIAPGCYINPPLLGRLAKKKEFIGQFTGLIAYLLPTATVILLGQDRLELSRVGVFSVASHSLSGPSWAVLIKAEGQHCYVPKIDEFYQIIFFAFLVR
jgi:hypothetical protein